MVEGVLGRLSCMRLRNLRLKSWRWTCKPVIKEFLHLEASDRCSRQFGRTAAEVGLCMLCLGTPLQVTAWRCARACPASGGAGSHGGHRYALRVSDGTTTSTEIAEALAEVYYRARESAVDQTREIVVSWVDSANTETVLFDRPLANRSPVLRNWGMAARYHDITPAPGATETPLDLGYHPYREYMPEILDNEGEVVRLEVVLVDKAGGMLSGDERVFLSQELLDKVQAQGLVLRELRSSDNKARASLIEAADGKTPVSPEFMSRILQGLLYRHGTDGRTEDIGERREIFVAVFDGQAHSHTHTMEVRLVDVLPNPVGYVNTFIGTAEQSGMGVSRGTGNADNSAGMTFPGAAYPFGAVRLTPETGRGHGGYRDDEYMTNTRFVVTAFSGPGCLAAEGGGFIVGVGSSSTKSVDKASQESEAGYYKALLRGGGNEVVLEAAASSPRTATMRLTYQSDGLTGFISPALRTKLEALDLSGTTQISERDDHWVVTYNTEETGVCSKIHKPVFYVGMHIGKHQVSAVTKNGGKIEFSLRSDQRAVDIKISMSYTSRGSASRNIDVENPEWTDFEVEKEKARKAWNYYLSKVAIDGFEDGDHDKTDELDKWSIFYSALYRSLLHMNTASDVDGNYRGIGGVSKNVSEAPTYGYEEYVGTEGPPPKVYFYNFSGWDVYRSQMALVGLLAPALSKDMAISLLESAYVNGTTSWEGDREIPRWVTGYQETGVMTGDPGPPSVSSLFMFGSRSVSLTSMLEVLDRSSRHARSNAISGHHVLEGVASDAAIAQMALWMSQQDSLPQGLRNKARSLYEHARGRTIRALNLLDTQGYVKPTSSGGAADPKSKHYKGKFAEGNSIQYTFMIAHDVLGLKRRIDAAETSKTALSDNLISDPSGGSMQAYNDLLALSKAEGLRRWNAGERSMALRFLTHFLKPNEGYGSWYAFMGNEVAHSSPFLANWFEPHLTQNAARRVSLFGFRNSPGGLFGNEDLGATSAWYVWTAMGIYPVIPGVGGVTLVAPSFKSVEISVPGGKSVKLQSSSGRAEDAYIQSVRRDGRETSSVWLTASELSRGVELDFQVGASKSTCGQDASDRPPSYGDTESEPPADYGSIWLDEGDDATGASSHSAFDGNRNTAWRFVSETDGSKVLEVEFTSVYAAKGLLLRHADVGRTSTLNSDLSNVTVSVAVKEADGTWRDAGATRTRRDHDARRMLLNFAAREKEIHGLRLTFAGLDVNEEHGIYEVLAKGGSVVEATRLRSRRSLLEGSLGDDVGWVQLSSKPALFVHGLHEQFQVTSGRILVLGESHISVDDLDTRLSATGSVDASRITLRVRDVVGGALQRRASGSATTWTLMDRDDGSPADAAVYSFSLADLRAGKIGFLAGDGTNPITFTIQAEDDDGNLSDSDSDNSGDQSSSVRIPVVGLVKVSIGGTSEVNSDGVLTPLEETLNLWRGAGAGGALKILVELHDGLSGEELLLGSHGVTSITSSWIWDAQSGIGTLSLEGDSTATALNFRAMLDVLQLRSAVGASEGYRRILVRPDISGSALRKDFHVREVKVSGNDVNEAPKKPAGGLADQPVDEDATATYTFRKFPDKEDDAAGTDLTYGAKLVVGASEQDIPDGAWVTFVPTTQTFTFAPLASHVGSHTLRVRGTDSGGLWVEDVFELVVSAVNDAPEASAVPDRTVNEDATVTYQVLPFTDEDDDTTSASFTYVAQLVSSGTPGALPSWITFDDKSHDNLGNLNPTFRTFTFTPSDSSHVGDHTLRVTGTDDGGKSDFVDFKVTVAEVNDVPKKPVAGLADPDDVDEDTSSTYKFDAFTDEETSALTYTFSVKRVALNGDPNPISTPKWITLVSATRTFTFTPTLSTHAGTYEVTVVATDAGIGGDAVAKKKTEESAEDVFELVVSAVNDAPEASAVPDKTVDEDATVTYQVLPFTDEDDDTTSASFKYVAQLVSSGTPSALPSWITFDDKSHDNLGNLNPTFRTFTFTPSDSSHVGDHTLRVTGTDDEGLSDYVEFKVKVGEVNDAPEASAVPDKTVDEDATVTYQVLPFTDEDDDIASASFEYEANLVVVDQNGDKILSDIPDDWIKFDDKSHDDLGNLNPTFRTFTFTPEAAHVGDYTLRVTGTDSGKKSDFVDFKVTVKEVNDPPKPPTAALANHVVDEDVASDHATVTYRVPEFTDEETSALLYSYTVVRDGSATPVDVSDWVKFDDDPSDDKPLDPLITAFREFTFEPSESSHAGDYRFRVTATDKGIGDDDAARGRTKESAYVEFMLKVIAENDLPEAEKLTNQDVTEDKSETYSFPKFTDEESSALEHTALWAAQGTEDDAGERVFVDLPADGWIDFREDPDDPTKMKFTFTPSKSSHEGLHKVRVTATDGEGGETSREFFLLVSPVNDKPKASSLANQDDVVEDTPSIYEFDAFEDEEDDALGVSLKYRFSVVRVEDDDSLTQVSGSEIGWIDFVATTRTFTFKPDKSTHAGTYKVTVVGRDAGGEEASAEFTLTVGAFNDKPVASSPVAHTVQEVDEDMEVLAADTRYEFPAFTDEEDDAAGVSLTYTFSVVRVVSGVKTPISTPDWIDFDDDPLDDDPLNPTFLTFTFYSEEEFGCREVRGNGCGSGRGHSRRTDPEERLCEVRADGFGVQRRACCEQSGKPG